MLSMLDPMIVVVAIISFLAGSIGYVLVRFVATPIVGYGRIKGRVRRLLKTLDAVEGGSTDRTSPDDIRRLSMALSDCYSEKLPNWYRIYLEKRKGDDPREAVKLLMKLANSAGGKNARRHIDAIRRCLAGV